jgi:dihydrofolate reductase
MICAILAMSQNRVIAREGRLPWDLPEDLAFFKKMTLEHPVIMGRKTFTSMGRPLPRRANIVISRNSQLQLPGATVVPSLLSAIEAAQKAPGADKIFVIGGAEVVREALPMIEEFYLTVIQRAVQTLFNVLRREAREVVVHEEGEALERGGEAEAGVMNLPALPVLHRIPAVCVEAVTVLLVLA